MRGGLVLYDVFRIVHEYRTTLEADWPTPVTKHAIEFALTEGGEAIQDMVSFTMGMMLHGTQGYDPSCTSHLASAYSLQSLEAELRRDKRYNRNADRVVDAANEWADCAIMVATAIEMDGYNTIARALASGALAHGDIPGIESRASNIIKALSTALVVHQDHPELRRGGGVGVEVWRLHLFATLGAIAELVGYELPGLVEARLDRIRERIKAKKAAQKQTEKSRVL